MPGDSRRLQGPEDAFSYRILDKIGCDGRLGESAEKPPLVVDGIRKDGRKPSDARPLCNIFLSR